MRLRSALLSLTVVILWPQPGEAWRVEDYCWGDPSAWDGAAAHMDLTRDPARDAWGHAMMLGMGEWNSVPGAWSMFDWTVRTDVRSSRFGNGRNEFGVARSAHIDDALGLTRVRRRLCFNHPLSYTYSGDIIEADVHVAGDRALFRGLIPDCDQHIFGSRGHTADDDAIAWDMTLAATILHELGHALGLQHEDGAMSLMMTSAGEGRYCGAPQFAPHPDDVAGMRRLYRDGEEDHDLAASSFELEAPNDITMTMARSIASGCPGRLVPMSWSVANRGTETVTFDVLWYAARNAHFASADDVLIGVERGLELAPGRFETRRSTVRISRWQDVGVEYFTRFELWPHVDREVHSENNASYTAQRLVRMGGDRCR